jgi:hypothetical protein
VIDHPRNYDGLDAEAVTLTFVASLNALLGGVAERLDLARPEPIPPTRRERRWLDEGNQVLTDASVEDVGVTVGGDVVGV